MIRLLIATTFLLGSCAGTTNLAVQLAREVSMLAAAVEELESRLVAMAAAYHDDRADEPPLSTAGRRREDHAPAAAPGAGSGPGNPAVPDFAPAPTTTETPPATPVAVPARPSPEAKPVVDPVRELARTVEELRARMERGRPRLTPIPPGDRTAVSSPKEPAKLRPSARRNGRFQIAGHGEAAWQTVLDTHTGVVHNFRIVDGKPQWVPITRPVGR